MAYIGRTPSFGEVIVLKNIESSFNGTLTGFDLHRVVNGVDQDFYAISSEHLLVSLGGIIQEPDRSGNVGYTIKSSYVLNLIDVLPKSIDLPSSTKLQSLPLTEQIKEISKYVVLVKVK